MENSFNGALEDISLIKKSINNSKINLKVIYKLFLISAIIILLGFIDIIFISGFFFGKESVRISLIYNSVSIIIKFIIQICFFIYYLRVYSKEKINSNKYYVNFLSLFGLVKFIIPFSIYIFRVIYFRFSYEINDYQITNFYNTVNIINGVINILFLYLSLNLLGEIVKKKIYKIGSVIILLVYLALVMFSTNNFYLTNENRTFTDLYVNAYSLISNLVVSLIMPISLKFEERKIYGNK